MSDAVIRQTGEGAENYDSCDLMKFIFSILIFIMHADPFGTLYPTAALTFQILSRGGVPFFFIASSFFLFRRQDENGCISASALKKYVRRVACLYLVWFIINLPSVIYVNFIMWDAGSLTTYVHFLAAVLLASPYTGAWFMMSCIFSAPVIYMLSKRFSSGWILLISFPFYLLTTVISASLHVLPPAFENAMLTLFFPNNIFVGLFYFAVGKLLAEHQREISRLSSPLSAALGLLLYALFFCEIFMERYPGIAALRIMRNMAFFALPATAALLFVAAMNSRKKISCSAKLRRMSTIIYCCQGNVLFLPFLVVKLLPHTYMTFMFRVAVCIISELLIVLAVLYLQKKRPEWRFLRYAT